MESNNILKCCVLQSFIWLAILILRQDWIKVMPLFCCTTRYRVLTMTITASIANLYLIHSLQLTVWSSATSWGASCHSTNTWLLPVRRSRSQGQGQIPGLCHLVFINLHCSKKIKHCCFYVLDLSVHQTIFWMWSSGYLYRTVSHHTTGSSAESAMLRTIIKYFWPDA